MSAPPMFMTDEDILMDHPEDLDLQAAVAVSMDEFDSLGQGDGSEGVDESSFESQPYWEAYEVRANAEKARITTAAQKALYEQSKRLQDATQYALEKRIDLPLLNSVDADTLVFIDPPPITRSGEDAGLAPADNAPHRMRSDRLKATGSTYFLDALGPTKQFRVIRRRRLSPLPPGIKYVIDLTPPEEGDMAVELTTELSCPKGVRQYFRAQQRFGVRAQLVGGHDDFQEKGIINRAQYPSPSVSEEAEPIPMDYTAVRHHSAIERVLHIIEDLDPRIDSAPKMWSVFCVAKFLDCTSKVGDYIIGWIYTERNYRFIETLPEVALKIAEGLQNYMLCRDAFSVLVGEEALASVGKSIPGGNWRSRTRRRREELDLDSFVTRMEYASKAFAERVNATFTELVQAKWITEVAEYQKLASILKTRLSGNCGGLDTLSSHIRSFIRTRIYLALSALQPPPTDLGDSILPEDRNGRELFPYTTHLDLYLDIHHNEALLLRHYWDQLMDKSLLTQGFSQLLAPHGVWVAGIDSFQKTTWLDLLSETERFNSRLNNKLEAREITSFHASNSVVSILGSRTGPCSTVLSRAPQSEPSAKMDTSGTNYLPIRQKHSQEESPPAIQGAASSKDLPVRLKFWVQDPTPSILLSAGPSRSLPVRPEEAGSRSSEIGGLTGGTIDPRDMTLLQQKHGSREVVERTSGAGKEGREPNENGTKEKLSRIFKRPSGITPRIATVEGTLLGDVVEDWGFEEYIEPPRANHSSLQYHPFDLHRFLGQCTDHIHAVAERMGKGNVGFGAFITETLLCLDENEFKYLPLYAGGNDDGSGGVFDLPIPNAVAGPIGPGPRYHIGQGSTASSEFDMVDAGSAASSSFDTSMGVEDGYSDHLDRRNVYSDDEMSGYDVKGKGKAREVDEGDSMGDDLTVVDHGSSEDNDEDFVDVGDILMHSN
ncbi:hypothetical protein FGG08_000173 [Glutinoglossum americanum]|uniref:Uncharacterized protein n=1 Tax=Glutinoglossum americanum TaxID=1670608 RepID=A0A9P8L667_9PEZI|nr:hypothetical protein FGG08_000173 [Glutinoglossum americanum]